MVVVCTENFLRIDHGEGIAQRQHTMIAPAVFRAGRLGRAIQVEEPA
jgi:hypothetical protein